MLVPFLRPSAPSSSKPLDSCVSMPNNLGDKLQLLAGRSPEQLVAVELFVDLILERLNSEAAMQLAFAILLYPACW